MTGDRLSLDKSLDVYFLQGIFHLTLKRGRCLNKAGVSTFIEVVTVLIDSRVGIRTLLSMSCIHCAVCALMSTDD